MITFITVLVAVLATGWNLKLQESLQLSIEAKGNLAADELDN